MPAEFQTMNEYIYGEKNRQFYSDEALVARLLEETAIILEVVRKDYRDRIPRHLADIFSWYNAVANRLNLDVQEVLWQKYPGVCSYCLREKDCMCGIEHPSDLEAKGKKLRALRLDRDGREPRTLSEHQALHARLYAWQHKRELPIMIASHIVEEAGEVSEAFRYKDKDKRADEMADVLSWIFALATRMGLDLAEVMWEFYPYICRKCEEERCACEQMI
jgi:NTP pyrophosphatase (non-canonical NTP hydrolase)